ncbi:hypothetical protein [Streptomyces sp. NPDC056056]|uniref:hypothetical protein n=1 Tax=Streptomyces sp. NPDC056056 TaxID=3345698 RepID=UPI0035DEC517
MLAGFDVIHADQASRRQVKDGMAVTMLREGVWRREDWDAVRDAVFGDIGVAQTPEIAVPDADPKASGRPGLLSRLRR